MKPREDDQSESAAADPTECKGKEDERELKRLHVELVKLQEWARHKGLKVCIVFEGGMCGEGWDDQGNHRTRQSASLSGDCLARTDGTGAIPDVHPARSAPPARGGRDRDL